MKAVLVSLAVLFWFNITFTLGAYQYLYKYSVENTKGGYQGVIDSWAASNQSWGSNFRAPGQY